MKKERIESGHALIFQNFLSAVLFVLCCVVQPYAVASNTLNYSNISLSAGATKLEQGPKYTNEILIKVKSGKAAAIASLSSQGDADAALSSAISGYASFKNRHQARNARRVIRDGGDAYAKGMTETENTQAIKRKYGLRSARANSALATPEMNTIFIISVDTKNTTVEQAAAELSADPSVEYAVPNQIFRIQFIPSDPLYSQQWSHTATSAQAAWDIERGDPSVVVAIVDCGVDYTHEDLAANMLSPCGSGCAQGTGYDFVDIDTNSYKAAGWGLRTGEDYTLVDANPMDYNGHGTHCAGIVAASANNGKGVCGVAPGVKIMPVRAGFSLKIGSREGGYLESDDIANALRYAADNGADIISMSFGGGSDPVIQDAVAYAASLGVVLVASAGNNGSSEEVYPAAYDNVIAVAATGRDNLKTPYSNYGPWVDVAAPGGNYLVDNQILSTVPLTGGILTNPSGYLAISGTSMACPYVAGAAALLLSKNPAYTASEVTSLIKDNASAPAEQNAYIGTGIVDLLKSLQGTLPPPGMSCAFTAPDTNKRFLTGINYLTGAVSGCSEWNVSYGEGLYPSTWIPINSGNYIASNVFFGLLDLYLIPIPEDLHYYTIRLTVSNANGSKSIYQRHNFCKGNLPGWPLQGVGLLPPKIIDKDNSGSRQLVLKRTDPGFRNSIYLYNDAGALLPGYPVGGTFSGAVSQISSEAIADINGDNKPDFIITYVPQTVGESGGITAINSNGDMIWEKSFTYDNNDGPSESSPIAADLDNDGSTEIILQTVPSNKLRCLNSNGQQRWEVPLPSYIVGESLDDILVANVAGDARKEIIFLLYATRELFVIGADGTVLFSQRFSVSTYQRFNNTLSVYDFENDGKYNIKFSVVGSAESGETDQIINIAETGEGLEALWQPRSTTDFLIAPARCVDITGDGLPEIIHLYQYDDPASLSQSNFNSSKFKVCNSDGATILEREFKDVLISNYSIGDVSGDGIADIVFISAQDFSEYKVQAITGTGAPIAGFPKKIMANSAYPPVIGDLYRDDRTDLIVQDDNLNVYAWDLGIPYVESTMQWPMHRANLGNTSVPKPSVPQIKGPSITGTWVKGTAHAKEAGTNRALVVFLYSEGSANISASSVTYGGQAMAKVTEKAFQSGAYSYTGAFILNEAGVAAATSGAISVSWASAPTAGSEVVSVFLKDVNQTALFNGFTSGATNGATVQADALSTATNDLVLIAGTAANNGTYTVNNGFTRGIAETSASFGDITSAYKQAIGAYEPVSLTSSSSQRQTVIGFVVNRMSPAPSHYPITASAGPMGSISPSGSILAASGADLTFTISPLSHYEVDAVTVDGANMGAITSYTFSNVKSSHTISATFKRTYYTITAGAGPNGSITPSGGVSVASGENASFAISPSIGYEVDAVTIDGVNRGARAGYTFSNVMENHTIHATFKPKSGGRNVSILGSWVKGATHAALPGTNRALVVMLYAEGSGAISASSVTYGGQAMTKVTEKAFQSGAYSYTGAFILNEAGVAAATSGAISVSWASAPTAGSDLVSVFLKDVNQTSPVGATATGSINGPTVTTAALATAPGDLVLTAGTAGSNALYTIGNGFTRGIAETSAGFGDITSAYKAATGANETPGLTSSISQRQTIIGFVVKKMDAPVEYTLTVTSPSGNILLNPPGGSYAPGTVVTITAEPFSEKEFFWWRGDVTGGMNPITITMDGNKNVTAEYMDLRYYSLSAEGINGTVVLNPAGGTYANGTVVTLTAVPFPGYEFSHWSDDLSGYANPATITMNEDKGIRAHFVEISSATYTLSAGANNGSITLDPPGFTYARGTVVTITAEPFPGYQFADWSGDLSGSANPATITMDGHKSVMANCIESTPVMYTLTTNPVNGRIFLNPPGGTYASGTVVTVTAEPFQGYDFLNWSGDLSGTVNPATIIMDANKTVTSNCVEITSLYVKGLTGWVSGAVNNKVAGNNRLMTVMVMGESNANFSATGVTYGGQAMTKQTERMYYVNGNRSYAAIFTLKESGVNAAASGAIVVTWSATPSVGSSVYSVLLSNVDQATPVSAAANNAVTGTSVKTAPLMALAGDMVIMCGATESNNSQTLDYGFEKKFESNSSWGDGVGGNKTGNAFDETPGFTQTASGRMVVCAIVVNRYRP